MKAGQGTREAKVAGLSAPNAEGAELAKTGRSIPLEGGTQPGPGSLALSPAFPERMEP